MVMFSALMGQTGLYADKVILSNGDVLHGRVLSLAEGKLTFESKPLGTLSIVLEEIKTIQTDAALTVILREQEPAQQIVFQAAEQGVYLVSGPNKECVALQNIYALGKAAEKIARGEDKKFRWTGSFEAGLSGRSGNTQRAAVNGRFDLEARNPDWILKAYFRALIAEQEINGRTERTDHELRGGGRVQRKLTDGLTAYFQQELERDKIEELNLRSVTNGGLGMRWLETDQWYYENRIGLGCEHERFDNGQTSQSIIGELTSDLSFKVNDRVRLTQTTTWLPNLHKGDSYRITAESAALIYLDDSQRWFLKGGLKHDYDNQPVRQVERLDTHYFTNIGYSF